MDNTIAFYEAVIIFAVTYIGIIFDKIPRTICALVGGGMMIYFHHVTQDMAIKEFIDFNTLGLLAGMMVLISIVKQSGFFEAMALWAVKKSRGKAKTLLILLSAITGIGAALIDSVTAALLIAPMTISICRMIRINFCQPYSSINSCNKSFITMNKRMMTHFNHESIYLVQMCFCFS